MVHCLAAEGRVASRFVRERAAPDGHADAKTTEVYRHYAPDPTHGADMVGGRSPDGPIHGPI